MGESIQVNVRQADFFHEYLQGKSFRHNGTTERLLRAESFDLIIGNPPFGGTLDQSIEDDLDTCIGVRMGKKIKKETYAFFIVACLDLLRPGGTLVFICSDTILTISTMTGLRRLLMECGDVELHDIKDFSNETTYPMLLLHFTKMGRLRVKRNAVTIDDSAIRSTANFSWGITSEFAKLFRGPLLADYFVATSGMTTGRNELFVRKIDEYQRIVEPYRFEFYDAPITVEYELSRARLGKLPNKRRRLLRQAEDRGDTERRLSFQGMIH